MNQFAGILFGFQKRFKKCECSVHAERWWINAYAFVSNYHLKQGLKLLLEISISYQF